MAIVVDTRPHTCMYTCSLPELTCAMGHALSIYGDVEVPGGNNTSLAVNAGVGCGKVFMCQSSCMQYGNLYVCYYIRVMM